jgi:thiamine transport system permease protein
VDAGRASLRAGSIRPLRGLALAVVPLGFLAIFFAWPFAAILERSLVDDGRLDLPFDVLTSRSTLDVAWFTLWQATASTALTLAAGLPLAWALARFSFPGRRLAEALVLVPFVLPTVVVATALLAVLPTGLEGTVWAILLAHVFFNVAVVVWIVGGYWSELDDRAWDAAATLGAGAWRRFRSVTLPLLMPALAAAGAVVFLFCFTSFGVIVILGGPRYATLEAEIYNQAARIFDLRTAAALALLQLAAVTAAVALAGRLETRLGGARRARGRRRPRPQGRQRVAVVAVVAGSLTLLAIPIAALVERSLSVPGGYGLDHFRALTRETPALLVAPWHAILNSLVFATLATAIALAVGIPAAIVAAGRRGRALGAVVMLPLGASAAMLGFGFLLAFDTPPFDLRGSPWLVPLAQALVAVPFVVRAVAPALRSIDERLREAAAVLGASPARVRREIELPLLARALGVATGLAFAIALGEFGATVFVARADWPTLPVAIFRFLGRPGADNVGQAMALSVTLMVLTLCVALVAGRAATRRDVRR